MYLKIARGSVETSAERTASKIDESKKLICILVHKHKSSRIISPFGDGVEIATKARHAVFLHLEIIVPTIPEELHGKR
jgi:hypothetical protein